MLQLLDIAPLPPKFPVEFATDSVPNDFTTVALVCGLLLLLGACVMFAGRVRRQRNA